jgi:hypothetical protein
MRVAKFLACCLLFGSLASISLGYGKKNVKENGVNPVFGGKYIFRFVYRQRYENIPDVFVDSLSA